MLMLLLGNIGRLRLDNVQMLINKIGTLVFHYEYKCVTEEGQLSLKIISEDRKL